jgi:hypothetical protein
MGGSDNKRQQGDRRKSRNGARALIAVKEMIRNIAAPKGVLAMTGAPARIADLGAIDASEGRETTD